MENQACRLDAILIRRAMGLDHQQILFDELLAAFDTACALPKPEIAEGLLHYLEDVIQLDDVTIPPGLSRLERLVAARFRLLEVKYRMRGRFRPD